MSASEFLRRQRFATRRGPSPNTLARIAAIAAAAEDIRQLMDGHPAPVEHAQAIVQRPDAEPVATAATAAAEAVERYYAAVRAPWVPDGDNTRVRKVRDERRADVCGCWPRYVGGCHCTVGGDRG